jgi:hypothetical protein
MQLKLENGSIIDIHQTVNGENLFVMLDVKELDLRYGLKYLISINTMF